MEEDLRKSGIEVIGDVPWGTHFCQFYRTKQDLIDILVPYFKAGLENNEFCMWITSEPLETTAARTALKRVVPDLDLYIENGQIEIMPHTEWYLLEGKFDDERVLNGWVDKLKKALERGYSGLRLTGNTFWLEKNGWQTFTDYEAKVNDVIGKYRMLAICTYCLDKCDGAAVVDVVKNHQFALIKEKGKWDIIESAIYKQAKEALKASEEKYRDLFTNMTEGFAYCLIITDSGGKPVDYCVLEVNQAWEKLTGLSAARVIGKNLGEIIPDLEQYWVDTYGKVALTGEPTHIENYNKFTDHWYEIYAYSPRKGYFVSLVKNITEHKKVEEALRKSEEQFRRAIEEAPIPIIMQAEDGQILQISHSWTDLTGYTREDIPTFDAWLNRAYGEGAEDVRQHVHSLFSGDSHSIDIEFPIQTAKGEIRYWSFNVSSPGTLSDGRRFVVGMAVDITERKRTEQIKDEFIGMVSHELRTPLTVVVGALGTAMDERATKEDKEELLREASSSAESLGSILDNMLELSRYQAGRLILKKEPCDIATITEKATRRVSRKYDTHHIISEIRQEIPEITCDTVRIEQVVYNLLENAVKYSPDGSDVRIFSRQDKEGLVVGVSDRGVGISSENQGKLFEPFERLEASGGKGVGLGLVVCKRLVEAHGGCIWVESKPGEGSTFLFTIPTE